MRNDLPKHEFEIKIKLNDAGFEKLARNIEYGSLRSSATNKQRLISSYFDTGSHDLRNAGLSLRVREIDGQWEQTLKSQTGVCHGISNPIEIDYPVTSPIPVLDAIGSKKFRKRVLELVGKKPLTTLFVTDINRISNTFATPDGIVELARDSGEIRTSTTTEKLSEVELELISGTPNALQLVAESLFSEVQFLFGTENKAGHGYRLVDGFAPVIQKPQTVISDNLTRSMTLETAVKIIFNSSVTQILHNWEVVLASDDPEGAHKMRVGIRRLRAAIKMFRPWINNDKMSTLNSDLRDLAKIVGELRDADVLIEDIYNPTSPFDLEQQHNRALENNLIRYRLEQLKLVRQELADPRWNHLKFKLVLLPYGGNWRSANINATSLTMRLDESAAKALNNSWKKTHAAAHNLDSMNESERHELRKKLKNLRYTIEFFQSLYPRKSTEIFVKELKALQDLFGYLQDVTLARKLSALFEPLCQTDPVLRAEIEYVNGWHTAFCSSKWTEAITRWKALKRLKPFWL